MILGSTSDCPRKNFRLCKIATAGTTTVQNIKFSYQNNGNIGGITDTRSTGGLHINQSQSFTYDDLNRLKTANGAYGTAGANLTLTYAYNSIGNITCNSALSACNDTTPNYTYGDTAHKHAVTNAGGTSYTYDANGNMIGRGADTLVYDDENRLTSVTNAGGTTTFVYDGQGNRVKKINGSVTKIYIGKYFECVVNVSDCKNSGAWTGTKHIFAGSTRIASKPISTTPGEIRYYHSDHLGSTSAVTKEDKAVTGEFFYHPFGETFAAGQDVSYKYTGQESDQETGLYFYNARYYDSRIGRFISADIIVQNRRNPQFLNRYSYTINNPVRYTDPSGHSIAANTTTVGSGQFATGGSSQFGCPPNCGSNFLNTPPATPSDPSNNFGSSLIGATSPNGIPAPDFGDPLAGQQFAQVSPPPPNPLAEGVGASARALDRIINGEQTLTQFEHDMDELAFNNRLFMQSLEATQQQFPVGDVGNAELVLDRNGNVLGMCTQQSPCLFTEGNPTFTGQVDGTQGQDSFAILMTFNPSVSQAIIPQVMTCPCPGDSAPIPAGDPGGGLISAHPPTGAVPFD